MARNGNGHSRKKKSLKLTREERKNQIKKEKKRKEKKRKENTKTEEKETVRDHERIFLKENEKTKKEKIQWK